MLKKNVFKIIIVSALVLLSDGSRSAGGEARSWDLYFTSPGKTQSGVISPLSGLKKIIGESKKKFYGAFFEISSAEIISELISAASRGVEVKLVTDEDNIHGSQVQKLINAGIPIVTDKRNALMHNKFAIIDDRITWTGSYNLTGNCTYRNNNNAIMILSAELADIYTREFMEMYEYRIFGNKKEPGVFAAFRDKNLVKIGDTEIIVYFSPENNVEEKILNCIHGAVKSINFLAFSFTSDKIGESIIERFRRGVKVRGVIETIGSNTKYSEYTKMRIEKIPVRLDKNRYRMHHKVIIIDAQTVVTGSYNFSKSADRQNDENVLIIKNSEIAAEYLKEFDRLYK